MSQNPLDILKAAAAKAPVLNYAYGVIGVAAAAAEILSLLHSWQFAVVGVVLVLIGMVLVWAVYALQKGGDGARDPAIRAIVWAAVIFFIVVIGLLISLATVRYPPYLADLMGLPYATHAPSDDDKHVIDRMLASGACATIMHHGIYDNSTAANDYREQCLPVYCRATQDEGICPNVIARANTTPASLPNPASIVIARTSIPSAANPACSMTALAQRSGSGPIFGADISHLDKSVDWEALKAAGFYFVFIKATQGTGFRDPAFVQNWDAAGRAGFVRGAYHFLTSADGKAQAANFLESLKGVSIGPCDLGAAVSLEPDPGNRTVAPADPIATARDWLHYVKDSMGRVPIVYTPRGYFTATFGAAADFEAYPLWIADYSASGPQIPPPWKRYAFWQFSDGYSRWQGAPAANQAAAQLSLGRHLSSNLFAGTADDLFALTR